MPETQRIGDYYALTRSSSEYAVTTESELVSAIAAASSNLSRIKILASITISSNSFTNKNTTLEITNGALITVNNGVEFTICGPLAAPDAKVFVLSGTGIVAFGSTSQYSPTPLIPQWWGALGDNSSDSATTNYTAFQAWANALLDESCGIVPPGTYYIDGSVEFPARTKVQILAYGARIIQYGINNVTFNLNKDATADGKNHKYGTVWKGGEIRSNTSPHSNTNVGIRGYGNYFSQIADVHFANFGTAAVQLNPQDSWNIFRCSFATSKYGVHIPNFTTLAGNPQAISINNCQFLTPHTAGAAIFTEREVNDFWINECYFIGSDSIILSTGKDANTAQITLSKCTFEQGSANYYYIRTDSSNNRLLYGLNLVECNFDVDNTLIADLDGVAAFRMDDCVITSTQDGAISIDSKNAGAYFRNNTFLGAVRATQIIQFANDRRYIVFEDKNPELRDVSQLRGWNGSGRSTGTGTINMSCVSGAWWSRVIPPRAWKLRIRARDSGSATNACSIRLAKDGSEIPAHSARLELQGVPDDVWRTEEFDVVCDVNGDIYYDLVATGIDTLDVYLMVVAAYW